MQPKKIGNGAREIALDAGMSRNKKENKGIWKEGRKKEIFVLIIGTLPKAVKTQ